MEKVDLASWERKEHFEFFSRVSQPFYSVTYTVDVTALYDHVKERGLSFYYAMIYLCTKAMNRVDAFLYVIREGEVYRITERSPSFTDLKKGSELFHIVTMSCGESLGEFCREARKKSEAQKCLVDDKEETDSLIYFSCVPWIELTALTNERDFDKDDSVPRIAWGKYVDENGRKKLQLSMELNHRLADGVHVGKFYQALCEELEQL